MVATLVATMKRAAAALKAAEIDFMLGGGMAVWARGGPETDHDVDFYVREEDAERGLAALASAGLRVERPPEEWLYKAHDGGPFSDIRATRSPGTTPSSWKALARRRTRSTSSAVDTGW